MLKAVTRPPVFRALARAYVPNYIPGTVGAGSKFANAHTQVTIFGASTGSLGKAVVDYVAQLGATCMIPFRGDMDETRHLKMSGGVGKINPIPFHPRDEESVRECIQNSDVVINLVGRYYETKNLLLQKNYTFQDMHAFFPEMLARVCNDMGVRHFLHVSALQQSDTHKSMWARSKAQGERLVREMKPETCIVRPADMFGVGDRTLRWIARHCRLYPFLLNINGGTALKQPVWYGDVGEAISRFVVAPETFAGTTMELAGDTVYKWSELIDLVADTICYRPRLPATPISLAYYFAALLELGPKPYISKDQVLLQVSDNVLSPTTECITFKDLGIVPKTIRQEGIREVLSWRTGGHWAFDDGKAEARVYRQ